MAGHARPIGQFRARPACPFLVATDAQPAQAQGGGQPDGTRRWPGPCWISRYNLLDTLIVRSVLVTALTLDVGRWIWWPSRLARKPEAACSPASCPACRDQPWPVPRRRAT